jgi:hypothetical protein
MRSVIFAINTTLDGCCDHTKQIADDEPHEYFTHLLLFGDIAKRRGGQLERRLRRITKDADDHIYLHFSRGRLSRAMGFKG